MREAHLRHEMDASIDVATSHTTVAIRRIWLVGAGAADGPLLLNLEKPDSLMTPEMFRDLAVKLSHPGGADVADKSRSLRENCAVWIGLPFLIV